MWSSVYAGHDEETFAMVVESGTIYRHRIVRSGGLFAESIEFVPRVKTPKPLAWMRVDEDNGNDQTFRTDVDGGALYRHMIFTSSEFLMEMVFVPIKTRTKSKSAAKKPAKKTTRKKRKG